jgi:hypothetical protein
MFTIPDPTRPDTLNRVAWADLTLERVGYGPCKRLMT